MSNQTKGIQGVVQTRICGVCRTVHDLPLCPERRVTSEENTKAPALPGYPSESGWYCIVFLDEDNRPNYGPIFKLDIEDGEHFWSDEDGDEVEHLFDTFLQVRVAMDAADGYVRQ